MRVSIVVAVSENGVIGRDGGLPWHLGDDLRRFKRITMGHVLIMGRRTWESIGRPLPGRQMVVVTRQADYQAEGVATAASLDAAMQLAEAVGEYEALVIGGAEIYAAALPLAVRLYITRVHAEVDGDARFPEVDWSVWRRVSSERREADAKNDYPFSFEVYEFFEPPPPVPTV